MPGKASKKRKMELSPLNPMVFYLRFSHISEQIFKKMNKRSLRNSRKVAKSWQNCIDNQNILWEKSFKDGKKALQLACKKGYTKIAKMIIQNSVKLKNGRKEVAEMLVQGWP